tara:strand:+ start:897 stop:1190 length:294 start_codon:yes stop_codon:yes gene_type:complete
MSRTYRRKKGRKFWSKDLAFYNGEFKNKKEVKAYFETDRFDGFGKRKKFLKHFSKKSRRAKQKVQLYKVVNKNDLSIHTYDNSYENEHLRKIMWDYM